MKKSYNQTQPVISELTDYLNWQHNEDFKLSSYAQILLTPDLLLAVTSIFFPEFILYKGAVILKFRFEEKNFETWYQYFKGEIRELEIMLNHVEIASDLFSNQLNDMGYENIEFIGERMRDSWEIALSRQFPDRQFIVKGEKSADMDDYLLVFWQQ